jgi:AcrR family transcriptional regulator
LSTAPELPSPAEPPRGADATAERLLQASHELLYERSGAPFSVNELCARAQANVAMVKYCFGNKDGLLLALTLRITDHFRSDFERLAGVDMGWREKLERHVAGMVRNYWRFPYINRLLADQIQRADEPDPLSESFAAPLAAFHRDLLGEGARAGEVRAIDPVLFFFSVVGMSEFLFTARGWRIHGFGLVLDEDVVDRYTDHVVELLLGGIAASRQREGTIFP